MSVVLVALPGAPKLNEETIRQDQELNQLIEKRLKGIYFVHSQLCSNIK